MLSTDDDATQSDDRTVRKQPSFKWAQFRGARSPTKQDSSGGHSESPHPSPQRSEYDMSNGRSTQPPSYQSTYDRATPSRQGNYSGTTTSPDTGGAIASQTSRQLTARPDPPSSNPPTSISTSSDNLKSFKVSLDDPAWKVLPAALKKYKINNDDWQNYAMFICYGSTGASCFSLKHILYSVRHRALFELRRKAASPFPEAEGREEESSFHAQAHKGYSIAYCCSPTKACCSKGGRIHINIKAISGTFS